jgi:hypothetical protein
MLIKDVWIMKDATAYLDKPWVRSRKMLLKSNVFSIISQMDASSKLLSKEKEVLIMEVYTET